VQGSWNDDIAARHGLFRWRSLEEKTMTNLRTTRLTLVPLLFTTVLGGCVWQSDYDAIQAQNQQLQAQNQQLQQQAAADKQQIGRLQGAIKYTVNSDLLFAPGSWTMSAQGERIISQMAAKLAPTQQNKLLVSGYTDDAPIGPALQAQGVTSNLVLSQKRADAVTQYLVSQGVKPGLLSAKGFGDGNPIASNNTEAGRSKNRRVELSLVGASG
jgi:chemotaxis protein MotB